MGWRSTGAAFRAGNYSGPLTSNEGGFASGFAQTFTAGISKAADIITGEMAAERAQKREEDLIRLRETLAAQRAAATASRTSNASATKNIEWAVNSIRFFNLDDSPATVSQLAALHASEGSDVQAGNALRELIADGVISPRPREAEPATPAAPPEADIASRNTTELPSVFNTVTPTPVEFDDLEATEVAPAPSEVPPTPVATPVPETSDVTEPEPVTAPTPRSGITITARDEGERVQLLRLQGLSADQLRNIAATEDPNTFRGEAARQLYQDSRIREIQATAEEATLLTIIQNGEDWEREAAREVLQNMGSSNEISRFKILPEGASPADLQTTGADVINVRMVRGENGRSVPVDVATGQPIDPARVVGPVTQDESERLVAILTAMNNPITAYQTQRNNFLAFADLSYEIGQMIERDETVTTNVAGFVSSIVSGGREASAIYNVLSATFSNDANAVVTQQDLERELRRNGTLESSETLDALANRLTVEDIFSDQTIDLAERRRVFEAKMVLAAFRAGGMEGQSGQAMSDRDFQRFTQFLNSARTNEGFRRSVGDYLSNGFRQTVQMENNLLNDGRVTEFRSMYFRDPLNLTTMAAAVEAEPRYRDALAYFGIIDAPAAPSPSEQPTEATEQPETPADGPIPIGFDSVDAFLSDPGVIAAAQAAGVTPEDMYRVYAAQNQGAGQ